MDEQRIREIVQEEMTKVAAAGTTATRIAGKVDITENDIQVIQELSEFRACWLPSAKYDSSQG